MTLLSFLLSVTHHEGYDDRYWWSTPEVVEFAVLMVFDVLTSAGFKYITVDPMPLSMITKRFSVWSARSPTLDHYFQQNLRQHAARTRTATKLQLCQSLLYNRSPIMAACGFWAWASISPSSRIFEPLEEIYRRLLCALARLVLNVLHGGKMLQDPAVCQQTSFAINEIYRKPLSLLARLAYPILLGRQMLQDSAVCQHTSFEFCPMVVLRTMVGNLQAKQDLRSIRGIGLFVFLFLLLRLAPIC